MSENLLEIKNLSVEYKMNDGSIHAVNDISFKLGQKETIGIVGETGAGKTTAALAILQLLPERTGKITSGEILYRGQDLLRKTKNEMRTVRGALISMIFQDPMTSLNPVVTVGEQIMESLVIHNNERKNAKELENRIDELLTLVNIQPRRKKEFPHQFSGGMKQRIGIAMALACEPELLIADEPTTALDVTIQAQVLSLMTELKEKLGTSTIMITHDLGVVAETCDKVAIMYAGEIVEQGTAFDIFEGERHHPYTVGLFGAIPNLEATSRRLSPIDGAMPDSTNLPPGCKFYARCKLGDEKCAKTQPEIISFGSQSIACHLLRRHSPGTVN